MNDDLNSVPQEEQALSGAEAGGQTAAPRTPGKVLSSRREELGLSVEQVASRLNLTPRQVSAIEADDFAVLPGPAIARGFVRVYAKLLQVDHAPLMTAMLNEEKVESAPMPASKTAGLKPAGLAGENISTEREIFSAKPRKDLRLYIALAAAALAVIGAAFFFQSDKKSETGDAEPAGVSTTSSSEKEAQLGNEAVVALGVGDEKFAPGDGTAGVNAAVPGAVNESKAAPVNGSTDVPANLAANNISVPNAPVLPGAATTVPVEDVSALVLNFREESWVEVRSGRKSLVSRLAKAGEKEVIKMDAPIKLIIGNAKGVDASLRGTPLELQSATTDNVVRLSLK